MESCRCESILLGVSDYGEADRIVTLFTREQGKFRALAKGAKRSIRRFGGILEPFARVTVEVIIKSGLSRIVGADAATIFPHIREDILKIGYAGYACEAVDLFLPDGLPNVRLFRLLDAYLGHLDQAPPTPSDRRFFEINFLNILGYRPSFDQCATCGIPLTAMSPLHAGDAGSLLCGTCGRGCPAISAATVKILTTSLRTGRFGATFFTPPELAEAAALLDPAIASHVIRPLKSLEFLREVGGDRPGKVS